jgi:hypothetical protein
MSIKDTFSEPTVEEVAAYFSGFPSFEPDNAMFDYRAKVMSDSMDGEGDVGKSGQVGKDSPTVIAFADGVKEEVRDAIRLSAAFAEMAATKEYSLKEKPIEWHEEYAKALYYCGWTMAGGHDYGEYKSSSQSLTMDSVVLELIGAIAGPNAATVISLLGLTLEKLQKNEPLMQLFERNSKEGVRGTCRIMPCVQSAGGTPITYMVSLDCEYSDDKVGVPFFKWEVRRLSIKRLVRGVEFDGRRYKDYEDKIKKVMGADADKYFAGFD